MTLFFRVWLPFAAGVYLSYLSRAVTAVIGPAIASDLALSAADLGFMASAYFLAFTAAQLPVGLLLDRCGPRPVQVGFLLVGASGAVLFALAQGWETAITGRLLLGLGLAASLMALIKASAEWFPPGQLARLNGPNFAVGGFGALTATVPAAAFAEVFGWRAAFLAMAAMMAVAAGLLALLVPRRAPGPAEGLGAQWAGLWAVLASPQFRRIAPFAAIGQGGAYMAVQGLWAGPWLRDVAGFDAATAAACLLLLAGATMAGHILQGLAAGELHRRRRNPVPAVAATGAAFVTVLLALGLGGAAALPLGLAFGFLAASLSVNYTLLASSFPPRFAGRANTALNLVVFGGAFLGQWGIGVALACWPPQPGGGAPPQAYAAVAFGLAALTVPALLWFAAAGRLGPRWRFGRG